MANAHGEAQRISMYVVNGVASWTLLHADSEAVSVLRQASMVHEHCLNVTKSLLKPNILKYVR